MHKSQEAAITSSCLSCNDIDNLRMVCCDNCDGWYHFSCVGVTAAVAHVDWRCATCTALPSNSSIESQRQKLIAIASTMTEKNHEAVGPRDRLHNCNSVSASADAGAANAATSVTKSKHGSKEVTVNLGNESHNVVGTVTDDQFDHEFTPSKNMSSRNSNSSKCTLNNAYRLRTQLKLLDDQQQILQQKEVLLQKRQELLNKLEEECCESDDDIDSVKLADWLQVPRRSSTSKTENNANIYPQTGRVNTRAEIHNAPLQFQTKQTRVTEESYSNQPLLALVMDKLVTLEQQINARSSPIVNPQWLPGTFSGITTSRPTEAQVSACEEERHQLTRAELAARKSITKDLPKFNGTPDEWPLFIATYEQTTQLCGYSNGENLDRLRHALVGAAHKAVRNLLLHDSCVPQILATLKMRFGRPELIIGVLLKRIRDIPAIKDNRLESLVDFSVEVQNACATMKASGLVNHLNNPELEQELVAKLPSLLSAFWGMHKLSLSSCNLGNFSDWLFQLAQGANNVIIPTASTKSVQTPAQKRGVINTHALKDACATKKKCVICKGECTTIVDCMQFKDADRGGKWKLVRTHKLCRICLRAHYPVQCTSTIICNVDGCKQLHHPLMHKETLTVSKPSVGITCNTYGKDMDSILFRVLPVTLYGIGVQLTTFAFFDDGSSLTLMDAELQRSLNIKGVPQPLYLRWTANTHRYEDESEHLDLKISAVGGTKLFSLKGVHTVKELDLPPQTLDATKLQSKYRHLRGITLSSYVDATPKLLIGLNNSWLGLSSKSREGSKYEPVAEKTRLGWTIKGMLAKRNDTVGYNAFHVCDCDISVNTELLQIVKKYICLDNLDIRVQSTPMQSKEDEYATKLLQQHTTRIGDRFETSLLWRSQNRTHPNSLPLANRRALCLRDKLFKDPGLAETLRLKMNNYQAKGYARKLPPEEIKEKKCWYLPIFPVYNPNKPGKVRLVWDAAAKTNGLSLNTMLLKGPDQLTCLTSVLRRFRQRLVAITGDIEEMFHQVKIRVADQNYQRFLWFEPGSIQPAIFAMTVMTFGATCSPSCAQYVKNANAEEFRDQYPRAVQCIVDNHYVDDMLDSMDTDEEVIMLARHVEFIHSKGGFHIRNWRSNSKNVLKALNTVTEDIDMNLDMENAMGEEKVLGMWWLTSEDCFAFKVSKRDKHIDILNGDRRPTKREVLSIVMSIFDPLGLIAFYVIYAKIVFQEIWRSGCSWDESIPDDQYIKWLRWIQLFSEVEGIKIPRCYFRSLTNPDSFLELHTFVDASENGYAAVCYLRITNGATVDCILLGSKVRVAPLKMLSIPRLELQAAILGARLAASMISSHTLQISNQTLWSDSRTVLSWLRSDHRRYSQFVAFRISEILELTEISDWRWVPSAENVADDATKWQKAPDFSSQSRWFIGPAFLKRDRNEWPEEKEFTAQCKEELRSQYIGCHREYQHYSPLLVNPERFSRWNRLLRVVATVVQIARLWACFRRVRPVVRGDPTHADIKTAEKLLWKDAQFAHFSEEIVMLSKKKIISRSSSIYKLSPYLDEESLLRLGGRVCRAGIQDPVILPKDHHITRLIVMNYHLKYHHGSSETVVNEIRQVIWIPKLRTVVNKVRSGCQVCLNSKTHPRVPRMAPLPSHRVTPFCRPFSYVGVDYFGPILVSVRRSTEKRYGVLLTCLTTRAIHLEVAYSLSTASCIIAIRNFMARRGVPVEFWSDNGTNFKGAERELMDAFVTMDKNEIVKTFTSPATQWRFIPPASPHMGGVWERLVRSTKDVLSKVLRSQKPSDELLRGALMEVEMIINSRPLTYIPINPEEEEALTPNHFLLGNSSGLKPLAEPVIEGVHLRRNWRVAQQLADAFWRRWVREYLPVITRRTKWFDNVKPIEVGDIVYIADPNGPRNCWPKGRVVDVRPGVDGQVRSATVKTTAGTFERPAAKIAVLSVYKNEVGPGENIPRGSVAKESAKCGSTETAI